MLDNLRGRNFVAPNNSGQIPAHAFKGFDSLQSLRILSGFDTLFGKSRIDANALIGLNQLSRLSLNMNMKELDISFLKGCPLLEEFYFEGQVGSLYSSEIFQHNHLKVLKLYKTSLAEVSENFFESIPAVKELVIANGTLSTIPAGLRYLKNLMIFSAANNQISRIQRTDFSSNKFLREINLRGNQIVTIEKDAFLEIKGLNQLILWENPLEATTRKHLGINDGAEVLCGSYNWDGCIWIE